MTCFLITYQDFYFNAYSDDSQLHFLLEVINIFYLNSYKKDIIRNKK